MSNFFQRRYYSSKDYIKYAASKHWVQILLAFIIMGLIFQYIGNSQLPTNSPKPEGLDWWTKCLDPLIGLGTFLIALAVWFLEVNRERKNDMPNKLTVKFVYKETPMMTCEKAYLASEGDIRAWGQQIGSQMAGVPRLDLKPYIEQDDAVMEFDENGEPFLHYQVTFFLNSLPIKSIRKKSDLEQLLDFIHQSPLEMQYDADGKLLLEPHISLFFEKQLEFKKNKDITTKVGAEEDPTKYHPVVWRPRKKTLNQNEETWMAKNRNV